MLELLVTIIITAMMCVAVLSLLNAVRKNTTKMTRQMEAISHIHFSLDRLMTDIVLAGQNDYDIKVNTARYDWHDTSHLVIRSAETHNNADRQIEWIASPRREPPDLVLFRRDTWNAQSKDYIPICENLHAFKVEILNEDAVSINDPNQGSLLIDVEVQLYSTDPPEPLKTITVHRSFCLDRFNTPGTPEETANDN